MAGGAGKDPSPKISKRKGGAKARKAAKAAEAAAIAGLDGITLTEKGKAGGGADRDGVQARNASGILASEARARDIKIQSFSLSFHSKILVEDSTIEMNYGRRWVGVLWYLSLYPSDVATMHQSGSTRKNGLFESSSIGWWGLQGGRRPLSYYCG